MRVQVRFTGRVQGVGFRATARDAAQKHPVTGWVRNEPDGSVLMEVQGSAAAVSAALNDLQARMARNIRNVSRVDLPEQADEAGFAIRR
jgi:acylphosphatase